MVRLRVRVWFRLVRVRDRVVLRSGCGLVFELVRVGVKVRLRVGVMVIGLKYGLELGLVVNRVEVSPTHVLPPTTTHALPYPYPCSGRVGDRVG